MNVYSKIEYIKNEVATWKRNGDSIGFIPTMGYLHEGHASLIKRAKKENDRVVVSIFVNPMQFGVNEDLDSYPRNIERDSEICREIGVDIIFIPEANEMYGKDFSSYIDINVLGENLCGKSRPVHFKGVCTVVGKLLNIVEANRAYFGEKDAQQLAIIKRFTKDLNFNVEIIGCPIVREEDGLAKSSRNVYLNNEKRKAALILSKALAVGRRALDNGEKSCSKIFELINNKIEEEPLAKVDYIEIVDVNRLQPIEKVEDSILVAIAVYIGNTRLIDNFTFHRER